MDRQLREDSRPGSVTTNDTRRMRYELARPFKLPTKWNARSPLRARLSYESEETRSVVGGPSSPLGGSPLLNDGINSVLTNNGRQAFNFNADTDLSDIMSFSITGSQVLSYDRSYNRRVSNTVFSAILNLTFFAGQIR